MLFCHVLHLRSCCNPPVGVSTRCRSLNDAIQDRVAVTCDHTQTTKGGPVGSKTWNLPMIQLQSDSNKASCFKSFEIFWDMFCFCTCLKPCLFVCWLVLLSPLSPNSFLNKKPRGHDASASAKLLLEIFRRHHFFHNWGPVGSKYERKCVILVELLDIVGLFW